MKRTDGNDTFEVRNGDVYRNNQQVGYVSGDELRIGGSTVRFHPHDGDVYVNNRKVGYQDGRGDYHVGNSEWRPTK